MRFAKIMTAMTLCAATLPAAYGEVENLACNQISPSQYELSYSFTGTTRQVEILASNDPAGVSGMRSLQKTSSAKVTVEVGDNGQRIYFFLRPDQGRQQEVSVRRLPLAGTPNFRDLGGYQTTDGRAVRWGLLYRSGALGNLTDADLDYLSHLGVRTVADFRSEQENTASQEKWITDNSVHHLSLPIDGTPANMKGQDMMAALQKMLASNPTPEQLRGMMAGIYRSFAIDAAPQYARVFRELIDNKTPIVYHCTAGKDRTGVFSALVLLSLGVPEKTVIEDYTLTNHYLAEAYRQNGGKMPGADNPMMAKLPPQYIQILMMADPDSLTAALHAIDAKYGSFDNYRRQALMVSDQDLEKLRARLLVQ
jgi:protein-tyrosine phosphatase